MTASMRSRMKTTFGFGALTAITAAMIVSLGSAQAQRVDAAGLHHAAPSAAARGPRRASG